MRFFGRRAVRPALPTTALLATALLMVSGCSGAGPKQNQHDREAASAGFPVIVENCGTEVTFEAPPERVMLLESAPVTILDGIGVFDRVVARAGSFPPGYYDAGLSQAVESVPSVSDELNASGHLMISQEAVIGQTPDLVLGLPEGFSRQSLSAAGINVLTQELYCPGGADGADEATFATLYDEIRRYGVVFDRRGAAAGLIKDLKSRVEAVKQRTADGKDLTAAVLYPTVGGGPLYAYGSASMAQPQLEAAGLANVFADSDERVFEVQAEQLIAADPDVLILLYQGREQGTKRAVTSLPGAQTIDAVAEDRIMTQLFNFTEPASPLTVKGLEMIAEQLDRSTG
ncbi:ABC transporter substrate-binding protein [Arthrobacter castelli]|uniref:ABC transporter substrate-binding protein n=1 Tax=Arthrobacter castelli TaxID=271431 RepID=UPI0003FB93A4|nr:ABC transporter substrate-binding protein [Arthrobacter castelli]